VPWWFKKPFVSFVSSWFKLLYFLSRSEDDAMLVALLMLLSAQLAGEAAARGLGLPTPGPVLGLALLALVIALSPKARQAVEGTAVQLLRHLSLLFVPAAVGIIQHLPRLAHEGLAIGVALIVSTLASLAVTALTFRAVMRLLRIEEAR
jgi:holin-like protein